MLLDTPTKQQMQPRTRAAFKAILHGLSRKGFVFIMPDDGPDQLLTGLEMYDKGRTDLTGKIFKVGMGLLGDGSLLCKLWGSMIGFTMAPAEKEQVAEITRLMCESFSFNATRFSSWQGLSYFAAVDCDELSLGQIGHAIERFTRINQAMLELSARLQIKVFGKPMFQTRMAMANGSICLVTSRPDKAARLATFLAKVELHDDSFVNLFKKQLCSWKFWGWAALGFISGPTMQMRQEKILYNATARTAHTSVTCRLPFQFGFALSDIVAAPAEEQLPLLALACTKGPQ